MRVKRLPSENGRCRLAIEIPTEEAEQALGGLYTRVAIAHGIRPEKGISPEELVRREVDEAEIARTASNLLVQHTLPRAEDLSETVYIAAPACTYDMPACKGEPFYYEAEGPLVPRMRLSSYEPLPVGAVKHALEEQRWDAGEGYLLYWSAEALAERLVGRVPDDAFASFLAQESSDLDEELLQRGSTREEYLMELGMSEDELSRTLLAQSRSRLRQMLALDAYARERGIEVDEDDMIAYLNGQTGGHGKVAYQQLVARGGLQRARLMARRAKCNRVLVEEGLKASEAVA